MAKVIPWLMALALVSCGGNDFSLQSGQCAGPQTGTWQGTTQADLLYFDGACQYRYMGVDSCKANGNYSKPLLGSSGTIQLVVTGALAGKCPQQGTHTCTYAWSGKTLKFGCGQGVFSYQKNQ
jgi:hypothetical protein